jgi:hypothetical protein
MKDFLFAFFNRALVPLAFSVSIFAPTAGKAEGDIGWCGHSRAVCMGLLSAPRTPTLDPNAELEAMRQRIHEQLSQFQRQQVPSAPLPPPAFAYYNSVTDEFFRGDQTFHRNEHNTAIKTMNRGNTRRPSGVGWQAITETEYGSYLSIVLGTTQPMDQTIYNNCVVARSRGASESVVREVRASCRETARNPSRLDRLRWGG